jgi:hypothetical protein
MYLMGGESDTNFDWIVKPASNTNGSDTTTTQGDPPDGKVHMARREDRGRGKVAAGGCTFFSVYEIQGTSYSNRCVLANLEWG